MTLVIPHCEGLPPVSALDSDLFVVGHTTDTQTALELCAAMQPDLALIDLCDSGINGLRMLQALRMAHGRVKLLILSRSDDPEYARAALKIGVSGYLLSTADMADLALSIRTVYRGQIVCSPAIVRALISLY